MFYFYYFTLNNDTKTFVHVFRHTVLTFPHVCIRNKMLGIRVYKCPIQQATVKSVSGLHCIVYNTILLIHISRFHICLCVCVEGPRSLGGERGFHGPQPTDKFLCPWGSKRLPHLRKAHWCSEWRYLPLHPGLVLIKGESHISSLYVKKGEQVLCHW